MRRKQSLSLLKEPDTVSGLGVFGRPPECTSEIQSCSLQVPLNALERDPPKLELELHCDIVVIWPVIPSAFFPRLNRAFSTRISNNATPISPLPSMEL